MERKLKSTGRKDRHGENLCIGDTVRFFFDEFLGSSPVQVGNKYSEIVDVVVCIEGLFYFYNRDSDRAALIAKYYDVCEIVKK